MAVSRGLQQFGLRMFVLADASVAGAERVVRGAAILVDQVAVTLTPVDTGRARSNWVVSVGALREDEPVTGDFDKSGNEALTQGRGEIDRWGISNGSIFVVNNVPYIEQLNDGSSRQRPEGMLPGAIQAGTDFVRRQKIDLR